MKDREDGDNSKKLLVAKTKKQFTCYYCKKPGHYKKDCRKYAQAHSGDNNGKQKSPTRQHKNGDAMLAGNVLLAKSRSDWIVDSGATSHMCNNRTMFTELRQLESYDRVKLGDGSTLQVTKEGTVDVDMVLRDGTRRGCTLMKVLHVPELAYNLINVSKAVDAGKTVFFEDSMCEFRNESGEAIAIGIKEGSLYGLKIARKSKESVNMAEHQNEKRLWHRRLGHINEQSMKKLVDKDLVSQPNFDMSGEIGVCEACIGGKQCKNSFTSSQTVTSKPLELVHSDICGKMGQKSLGGAEYFLTFVDDYTHYTWVYPIKTKDQTFDVFKMWQAEAENFKGLRVKTLRTDNGGEFTSKKFQAHLRSCEIRHELTIPKTPELNGVAERLNRTLVEMTRAMLLDAKLSHEFWAEAVSTAAYLRNRCPTTAVQTTPHEAWHGHKPSVKHLKVFGCTAYVHIPKDERGKLDSKTRKCILLGYGSVQKGYKVFEQLTRKVSYSRNVKFSEQEVQTSIVEESAQHPLILDSADDVSQHPPSLESTDDPVQCPSTLDSADEHNHDSEEGRGEGRITDQSSADAEVEAPPRRSARERRPVDYYGFPQANVMIHQEPITFEEAINCQKQREWTEAMGKEMESLKKNKVWELTMLPPGKKAVGCKWVYKVKTTGDGTIERYKARLVARGFDQRFGSDYDETFCPVVRLESLRTLVALATQCGLELHHVDVDTAFLNGTLQEEVYMKQPVGYAKEGKEHLVCRLKKSLYGLKQSSRCWNSALDSHLKSMGFSQSQSDPCLYTQEGEHTTYIGVYVDDMILAGKGEAELKTVKDALSSKFDIKDLGKLSYFLGMSIVCNQEDKKTWVGQPAYTEKLLNKMGMSDCRPVSTPIESGNHLVKASEDEEPLDQQLYQSLIGSLMYLATCTRPDIAFAVGTLARFSSKPNTVHWKGAKRVLHYLKGTTSFGIVFRSGDLSGPIAYSDADWAGDVGDRKSTSGYVFCTAGGPVSWRSRKQDTVALSTAEVEYMALSSAAQECVWMRRLCAELGNPIRGPTIVKEDNQSCIAMAKNPQYHGRVKHIDIKHHFVRELVADSTIKLEYCPTNEMIADILTKGLSRERFCYLRKKAGMESHE